MTSKDINVLLDLDNTLIYSIDIDKVPKKPWVKNFKHYVMEGEFIIFERPGLQPFLSWLFKNFNVSVWSAASPAYVDFIVDNIIENKKNRKIKYVLNSNNCKISQKFYGTKNIKKLNLLWDVYKLENFGPYSTIIIDDLGKVVNNNKYNSRRIKSFIANEHSSGDYELENIKKKLIQVKNHYKHHINDKTFKLVQIEK